MFAEYKSTPTLCTLQTDMTLQIINVGIKILRAHFTLRPSYSWNTFNLYPL